MQFQTLPYDLLFHIAQYLDVDDVHNLQATCKSLGTFTLTRPVYRSLAYTLLSRSRPLPLPAFQRLADLSTQSLIRAVNRANKFEKAWRVRAPRPAISLSPISSPSTATGDTGHWYTKISAPPNEEIDWLSPITSSYTLCATKSGRVVCWDVARDICLAEWDPRAFASQLPKMPGSPQEKQGNDDDTEDPQIGNKERWELWKCRVEFDERSVYFTMARVLKGSYDDDRVMEFVLMKLAFPLEDSEYTSQSSSPMWNFSPMPCDTSQPKTPPMSLPASEAPSPRGSTLSVAPGAPSAVTSACLASIPVLPAPNDSIYRQEQMDSNKPIYQLPAECSRAAHGDRSMTPELPLIPQECPAKSNPEPVFFPLTSFYTTGVVMNVFLLDPPKYLLSAFVWVASSNTIGLYVLLDWTMDEYVFVDTGVGCLISSNWSCILHEDQIVIHSEEADAAYQYFYPLSILRTFTRPGKGGLNINGHNSAPNVNDTENANADSKPQDSRYIPRHHLPLISTRLPPVKSLSKKFVFPRRTPNTTRDAEPTTVEASSALRGIGVGQNAPGDDSLAETPAEPSSSVGLSSYRTSEVDFMSGEANMGDPDAEISPLIAEGSSKGKGKSRATEGDTIAEDRSYSSAPESSRQRGKGKKRESTFDRQEWSEDNEFQSYPSTPGSSSSSAIQEPTVVSQSTAPIVPATQPPENPYPFPPWYPESAHFVRQWWPTLPGVPRLSCTVVLLAAHDPDTHHTRFVLAQHYFRVPITYDSVPSTAKHMEDDDEMLHLCYVSTPFEVVCVLDSLADNGDEDTGDRPRPLVAVDFGHAVWVEFADEPGGVNGVDSSRLGANPHSNPADDTTSTDNDEGDSDAGGDASGGSPNGSTSQGPGTPTTNPPDHRDATVSDSRRHRPMCLRFVTFPPVYTAYDKAAKRRKTREEAVVRTLDIPQELNLHDVETINIDQSQGAVILSVKEGKIFILRYE